MSVAMMKMLMILYGLFVLFQITFELTVKQLMSFDPDEWTENLRKEYMLVINGFFTLPFPLFSATYRKAIKVHVSSFYFLV
jgi:hypothetical protein